MQSQLDFNSMAKGITFVTIGVETGTANLIARHAIWERFHKFSRHSNA
jgi:hypothetical protein